MKRYIKSSAMRKSDIGDEIQGKTLPLLEALAQLYIFPDSIYKHHWREEVWNKFADIPVLKRSHKLPKKDFILQRGWYRYHLKLKIIMRRAIAHESSLIPDKTRSEDVDRFYLIAESYMNWLATKLSTEEIIDPIECYAMLDSLGL